MDYLILGAQLILSLSILIVLHEMGHFSPARWFNTRVEKFYLFFDWPKSLFKVKKGDTEYGIGMIPLGGYVKISGMIDESMDKEQMALPPEPWEFRSKPAWQRLIVMVGGVTVNVLLAWVIFSTLLVVNGDVYIPADRLKYGLEVSEAGEALGFQDGDQILSIDDKRVQRFGDGILFDVLLGEKATVKREGREVSFPISDAGKKVVLETKKGAFLSPRGNNEITALEPNSLAVTNDIQIGDYIIGVNDNTVSYWGQFEDLLEKAKNNDVTITLDRNGTTLTKTLFIKEGEPLGVYSDLRELLVKDEYSVLASIPEGWSRTISSLTKQVRQFKLIFNKEVQGYKQVKGPIGIVEMMSPTWDWERFWDFTAMFSVWLAFVNILPIPALDGGHVMFLLYEMISGRKPSEKTLERGQIIGFIIVMGLMLVIFGNDIWNLFK